MAAIAAVASATTAFNSDSNSYPPPSGGLYAYNSFVPGLPPTSSYVDPVLGETVRRLTGDGSHDDIYARNM